MYKNADDFIESYMNSPIADNPRMSFHLRNAFNAGIKASQLKDCLECSRHKETINRLLNLYVNNPIKNSG